MLGGVGRGGWEDASAAVWRYGTCSCAWQTVLTYFHASASLVSLLQQQLTVPAATAGCLKVPFVSWFATRGHRLVVSCENGHVWKTLVDIQVLHSDEPVQPGHRQQLLCDCCVTCEARFSQHGINSSPVLPWAYFHFQRVATDNHTLDATCHSEVAHIHTTHTIQYNLQLVQRAHEVQKAGQTMGRHSYPSRLAPHLYMQNWPLE